MAQTETGTGRRWQGRSSSTGGAAGAGELQGPPPSTLQPVAGPGLLPAPPSTGETPMHPRPTPLGVTVPTTPEPTFLPSPAFSGSQGTKSGFKAKNRFWGDGCGVGGSSLGGARSPPGRPPPRRGCPRVSGTRHTVPCPHPRPHPIPVPIPADPSPGPGAADGAQVAPNG